MTTLRRQGEEALRRLLAVPGDVIVDVIVDDLVVVSDRLNGSRWSGEMGSRPDSSGRDVPPLE
ncbi:hypothetical protein ACWEQ7_22555 [Streptomyces sp. NPDC004069]